MAESYVLKTDRNAQWQKIESRLSETATKKQIKVCRDYFLDGLDNSKHFTWSDRFRLYHNPTLEGWQKLFDEEIQEPLTDGDFRTLQYYFTGQLCKEFFGIEDQDYYFKAAFGQRYDADWLFPLRINREPSGRRITLTPNQILFSLLAEFSWYVRNADADDFGVLRYNQAYLDSLLPLVDPGFFSTQAYTLRDLTEDQVRYASVQSATKNMIKAALSGMGPQTDAARIQAANAVLEVFQAHADALGEFNTLYAQVKKDVEAGD